MRTYLAGAMMGIGGIFVSFAAVVFVIEIYGSRSDTKETVAAMTSLGMETLVGGAILFIIGWLISRMGRRSTTAESERPVAEARWF
jgi:cytochrome bd-type quinol oxidase subunit 1